MTLGGEKINSAGHESVLQVLEQAMATIPNQYSNDIVEKQNGIGRILQLRPLLATPHES